MASVYVAGPVIRGRATAFLWADSVYNQLRDVEWTPRAELSLPVAEPALEKVEPRDFVQRITDRIRGSVAVISVLPDEDPSGPIEAVFAAALQKHQLIIAQSPTKLPRLIRGLPLARFTGDGDVKRDVRQFLESLDL